jgi:hypothetical protein
VPEITDHMTVNWMIFASWVPFGRRNGYAVINIAGRMISEAIEIMAVLLLLIPCFMSVVFPLSS